MICFAGCIARDASGDGVVRRVDGCQDAIGFGLSANRVLIGSVLDVGSEVEADVGVGVAAGFEVGVDLVLHVSAGVFEVSGGFGREHFDHG